MRLMLRSAMSLVTAAVALAHMGCGSGSRERTPTGSRAPAADGPGRVTALAVAPSLGTAGSYGVIGASTVTNTGPTIINGDLGISPGTTFPGFPPGIVNGVIHPGDAAAAIAQNDVTTAYNALVSQACDLDLTGTDLGGLTLTPGTYCFSSSAQLTGTLTLNGLGNPGSVWVFKIGSTLTTASGSRVAFVNSSQACGVFWQVGSSATFGTGTVFSGNVLALASITMTTGATSSGALFARTAAVTLDSNVVSVVGSCGGGPQPSPTPIPTLPQAAMWGLVAILLAGGVFVLGRR